MTIYAEDDFTPTIENVRQKRKIPQASFDDISRMEGMRDWLPKSTDVSNWGYINPSNVTVTPPLLGNTNDNRYASTNTYRQPTPLSLDEVAGKVPPEENISSNQFYVKDGNKFTNFPSEGYTPYEWKNKVQILPNGDKLYPSGSGNLNLDNVFKFNDKKFKIVGGNVSEGNFGVGNQGVFANYNKDNATRKPLISPSASYDERVLARKKVLSDSRLTPYERQYVLNKYDLTTIKPPEIKEAGGILYEIQPSGSAKALTPPVDKIKEKSVTEIAGEIYIKSMDKLHPLNPEEALILARQLKSGIVSPSVADDIKFGKSQATIDNSIKGGY